MSVIRITALAIITLLLTLSSPAAQSNLGPSLPSTCVVGDRFVKTAAVIGLYVCLAADTWTKVDTGGEGGGGAASWGSITGTLSNQTDLQSALDAKAATTHNHDASYAPLSHTHTDADIPNSITIDLATAATALAANPADCSANQFATTIAASGALTCAALTDADVPNTITINTAATATALAANPTDCTAGQYASAIDASGNLTCSTPAGGGGGASTGYTLGFLSFNPADAGTTYFAQHLATPASSASARRLYFRKAGTITHANVATFCGTAGTAENWTMNVRLNNTTNTLIETVAASATERVFDNSSLSIAVVAGDFIEIQSVQPTWVTNPLTCVAGGYVLVTH